MSMSDNMARAYKMGYLAGKNGGFFDDMAVSLSSVLPTADQDEEDAYNAGYEDGSNDRHDDDNPSYKLSY